MFLRRKRIRVGGKTYEYYAIVENVREGDRVRQKTLVHLGKLDLKDSNRVVEWLRVIAMLAPGVMVARTSDVVPDGSVVFAPIVAARAAWDFWRVGDVLNHRVYSGNTSDVAMVSRLVKEVKERFGIERAVFVGDRGMMSSYDNVKALLWLKYRYIMCLRHPKVPRVGEDFWEDLARHSERDLVVKDVRRGRGRFVVGYNPEKASL